MRPSLGACWTVVVAGCMSAGCGLNMQKNYEQIRPKLLAHNYDDADKYVESVKDSFYSKDNRLLYYMDKGMVLHLAKKYPESNAAIEQAKTAAEELWTESVGKNAAAWVTTDNSLPYQGEDFEKVLIHFVAALNHMGAGSYSDARVEARQITNDLELYNSKYEDAKNAYKDDAFSRWLSGRLSETDHKDPGSLNEAWIDYRKAINVYETDYASRYNTPLPQVVIADALRAAEGLGREFKDEFNALRAKYPQVAFKTEKEVKELGTVVLIHLNGEAPYKKDEFWQAQAGSDILRIAFPQFVPKPHNITHAKMRTQSGAETTTEVVENITDIAIQNLNDHMGRIQAKAITRAVAKFLAGKAAQAGGEHVGGNAGAALQVAGALWNIGNAVAEESDKRSWITLPAAVTVGELHVPPGPVTLDVDFLGNGEQAFEHAQMTTEVKAGETVFVTYRTYL